jgi:hypothetical protein
MAIGSGFAEYPGKQDFLQSCNIKTLSSDLSGTRAEFYNLTALPAIFGRVNRDAGCLQLRAKQLGVGFVK